jgi:hypothetical protein
MQTHPDDQHISLFEKKPTPGIIILPQGKVLPPTSIPLLIENLRVFYFNFFSTLVGGLLPANPHQQRIRFWKCSKCSATEELV